MEFIHNGHVYKYTIVRKRMRNIILHVTRDMTVYVSAPPGASEQLIQHFVEENADRLVQQMGLIAQRRMDAPDFTDRSVVTYLGEPLTLHWSSKPCKPRFEGCTLVLFARSPDEARLAYQQWLVSECTALYRSLNREVYASFTAHGYRVPLARIEIKEMHSRWGSCTASTGRISINFRLMQYPLGCIRGVFYHEYTHFLYSGHGKPFYDALRGIYPEYDRWDVLLKERND